MPRCDPSETVRLARDSNSVVHAKAHSHFQRFGTSSKTRCTPGSQGRARLHIARYHALSRAIVTNLYPMATARLRSLDSVLESITIREVYLKKLHFAEQILHSFLPGRSFHTDTQCTLSFAPS